MIHEVLDWLLRVLSTWWVWLPVVVVLLFLTLQNHRRIKHASNTEHVLLALEVPKSHGREGPAAEELFANLHNMLRTTRELVADGGTQDHLSFEIVSVGDQLRYLIWTPAHLQSFVESQIGAAYPEATLRLQDEDYASRSTNGQTVRVAELNLIHNDALPIKTYGSFEEDPLNALHNALSKIDKDEEVWIQTLVKPVGDTLERRSAKYIHHLRSETHVGGEEVMNFLMSMLKTLWEPPQHKGPSEPSEKDKTRIAEAEQKSSKPAFQVKIRILYVGRHHHMARQRLQDVIGAFKQFNRLDGNGFSQKALTGDIEALAAYRARFFLDRGFLLNSEELATLFHLPYSEVDSANISWADMKAVKLPSSVPQVNDEEASGGHVSLFGITRSQTHDIQFGVNRSDRMHHIYVTGLKGGGKTKLLELLALSDLYHNQGFAIFDPNGGMVDSSLRYVPSSRINEVVYFNVADSEFPIAFNPFDLTEPALKSQMATELIAVFKKTLLKDHWQPQLEYILRCTILALLEYPRGTLLDVSRMLFDEKFRVHVLEYVTDPIVVNFWKTDFVTWDSQFRSDAIGPIISRMGAFTSNPMIRNIVSQEKTSFNFRRIMDGGQIFAANLAVNWLGEENASTLGALLIAHMHIASMSRFANSHGIMPRPFYVYIDDFQYFITDSFAEILAEGAVHGTYMTISNPRPSQVAPVFREAVFGNFNTVIAFKLFGNDSSLLKQYFSLNFDESELTELPERHFVVSMFIDGQRASAFSGRVLTLPPIHQDYLAHIMERARVAYGRSRKEVEASTQRRLTEDYTKRPQLHSREISVGRRVSQAAQSTTRQRPAQKKTRTVEASWQHRQMPQHRVGDGDDQEMVFQIRR
ncbi:MAG TPA: hypothetical protein VGS28_04610 [Candidatus Saccharimonadales bacterium]|nr:hypothetical protein [Candidatus Saccharimonadales bacterium]